MKKYPSLHIPFFCMFFFFFFAWLRLCDHRRLKLIATARFAWKPAWAKPSQGNLRNEILFSGGFKCLQIFLHVSLTSSCMSAAGKNVRSSCCHPLVRQPDSSATPVTVMFYSWCEPGPFVSALVTSPAKRCYIYIYIFFLPVRMEMKVLQEWVLPGGSKFSGDHTPQTRGAVRHDTERFCSLTILNAFLSFVLFITLEVLNLWKLLVLGQLWCFDNHDEVCNLCRASKSPL